MSQVTGDVVLKAKSRIPDVQGHLIASALAVITGAIILFLGLARLGWLVEFIPLPAICAFMTGSAVNIIAGQVSKLMGISGVNTRDAPYMVIINTLKNLPSTKLDAALGLTALLMLYLVRGVCSYMSKKHPHRAKTYFFISTLRTVFVILLYTAISAGVNVSHKKKPSFSLIMDVPRGMTPSKRHIAGRRHAIQSLGSLKSLTPTIRFPTCCCPRGQQANHLVICLGNPRRRHCHVDRAHLHLEILRPHQQLRHRPIARTGCHWRHQLAGSFPWCLSCHWILLAYRHQVQGWCPNSLCRCHHRPGCLAGFVCPAGRFLLHSQRRLGCCHYPRRRRCHHASQGCFPVLARLPPRGAHLPGRSARHYFLHHRKRNLHHHRRVGCRPRLAAISQPRPRSRRGSHPNSQSRPEARL